MLHSIWHVGGVASTPGRAVRVQALAGDIVLSSWARHFTLTVPLSTQVFGQGLRALVLTYAHFGRDQICTQVKACFSAFGHPTQVNAS